MIVSGMEILRFIFFLTLVALAAWYVTANRDLLFENLPLGRSGDAGPAASAGLERGPGEPGTEGGTTPEAGSPEAGASDEALPVLSLLPAGGQEGEAFAGLLGGRGDTFMEFRLERHRARSLQLELLREVLDKPGVDEASAAQAAALWLEITRAVGLETDIEHLIRAKGFEDAVVVLSAGKATILVKAEALTGEEVLRIADIAVRVAGLSYEDITVVARGG
jgi:stage III sporulation protein AH